MKKTHKAFLNIAIQIIQDNKFRYLLIGGINTIFAISSSFILIYIGLSAILAQLLANILSLFFNYHTYSNYLFKDRNGSIVKFLINHIANYLLSACILKVLLYIIKNPYLATFLTLLVTIIINYMVLKNIVFKKFNK